MHFVKMHGIGNDYVYLDGVADPTLESRDLPDLARRMSDRHTGIGSDGIILVCAPDSADNHVRMRMLNADGSESEMCGNGIRCVAKFAHDRLGIDAKPMRVETGRGVLAIDYEVEDGRLTTATVDMGEPILDSDGIPVDLPRGEPRQHIIDVPLETYIPLDSAAWMGESELDMHMTCVSMGNPHVVIFCGVVDAVPLSTIGPFIERQPIFPNRVNVHFVSVASSNEATMRTWERGSGITRACGTGASAVLVAGVLTGRLQREALLHLPGGDLTIRWDETSGHVSMTGPATEVFEGAWPE